MSDLEFRILDELYFLQPYKHLARALNIRDDVLKTQLVSLLKKGWIRCYHSPTEEIDYYKNDFDKDYWNYYYLASKSGLLAHNSAG